jgi:hypothetical protein
MTRQLDDRAVAYDYFMVIVLLILGSLVWMAVMYGFNLVMSPVNDRIADGQMSVQTTGPLQFSLSVLGAVPVFLLIGVLVWVVLASVNKRNEGG